MRLNNYSYYEVLLKARFLPNANMKEKALFFFESCAIDHSRIVFFDSVVEGFKAAFYTREKKEVSKVLSHFRKAKLPEFQIKSRILLKEDWFDKWQREYQIQPLGTRFTLVPEWQRAKYKKGKLPIFIDPQGAFGSGTHATTQIMVELMEGLMGKIHDLFDLGCGTGILSIVGAHLGAKKIWAVDNDPGSVKAARNNAVLNQIRPDRLWRGDVLKIRPTEKFDCVAANMISSLLIDAKDVFFESVRKRGWLVVSGIHLENYREVVSKFKHPQFRCVGRIKKRGWAGLLFRRSGN